VVHFSREHIPVTLQASGMSIGPGKGPEFTRRLLTVLARWGNTAVESLEQDNSAYTVVEINDNGDFHWRMPHN
jgi:hypothetical protein